MSIGQRIIQLRTERNMSQNQLTKAMEISRQAVSQWENGQSTPDATKMIKLAEVLDTDVEYLTTGRAVVPSRPPVVLTEVQTVEVERIVADHMTKNIASGRAMEKAGMKKTDFDLVLGIGFLHAKRESIRDNLTSTLHVFYNFGIGLAYLWPV